jgi:heme/copper-type cytochrome/quinol oxidase subunit 4
MLKGRNNEQTRGRTYKANVSGRDLGLAANVVLIALAMTVTLSFCGQLRWCVIIIVRVVYQLGSLCSFLHLHTSSFFYVVVVDAGLGVD